MQHRKTEPLAIASLVLGGLGFLPFMGPLLLAPLGLVAGIVSLVRSGQQQELRGGLPFAIAGTALAAVAIGAYAVAYITFPYR